MSTCIHVYSEHRKDAEWVADEKATYNENVPTKHGWINATMKRTPCAEKYPFYGLLVDGARASWPWSFEQRGMPQDVSEEIRNVCDSFGFEGYGHTHLTLRDLFEKYLELLVSGQEASELKYYLRQLIRDVPRNAEDLEDIRIVLWFDS